MLSSRSADSDCASPTLRSRCQRSTSQGDLSRFAYLAPVEILPEIFQSRGFKVSWLGTESDLEKRDREMYNAARAPGSRVCISGSELWFHLKEALHPLTQNPSMYQRFMRPSMHHLHIY